MVQTFVAISCLFTVLSTNADDTEVFYSVNVSKPNLLFVLDNSGSMKWDLDGNNIGANSTKKSRLDVLKEAVQSVLESAPDNVNIGLMRFGPGSNAVRFWPYSGWWNEYYTTTESKRTRGVNGVAFPLTDINALAREVIPTSSDVYGLPSYPGVNETVRTYISKVVNDWSASGGTPLVDALYEAALYYRGEKMRYGFDAPDGETGVGAHPSTYSGNIITSDIWKSTRSYNNTPNYISPISSSCQANYIVLMSDGQPTYYDIKDYPDTWGTANGPFAQFLQGKGGSSDLAAAVPTCANYPSGFSAGKCGPELARYIADNDNNSEIEDIQTIKTYTIGFGANLSQKAQNYLKSLETIDDDPDTGKVEDGYFNAAKPEDLAAAFKEILDEVVMPKGTLASPGYSVNVKSGLEHEKSIYIPVFDRKNTSRWSGNLKKFKLVSVNDRRLIYGKNDKEAMDELGGFTGDAFDLWSDSSTPDGKNILKGGVADKFTNPDSRNLYSNITSSSDLTAAGNQLKESNTSSNITNSMLGLAAESTHAYRKKIINFIRGWQEGNYDSGADPKGIPRKQMGDMLHSEPYVYTYAEGQQTIFAATNEGFIHAFDTETGDEQFAFMPKELLKNIEPQLRNEGTAIDHLYGIDGAINLWHDTKEGKVYLYFGLRRGGRSYYALDVTDVNSPQFMWRINNEDEGYSKLGQTWSVPYLGKVGMGSDGETKEAVIFTGGYDPVEDRDIDGEPGTLESASSVVETTMGNDIFIADARNGGNGRSPLWSLQQEFPGVITDSIPGGVRYLDTNYNGIVDRMYFGDTGGHVWRLDLSENIGDSAKPSKLTLLASLGGTGSDSRKFYAEPDVAVMKLNGKTVFIVSIGSGYRAHPLDKSIDDKFFVLVDNSPYKPIDADNYTTITKDLLANLIISDAGSGASISLPDGTIKDHRGWIVSFPEQGEKVLSTALAFDGNITFTTLIPDALLTGVGIDRCAAPAVQGRFYAINVLTGKAGLYLNNDEPDPDSPEAGQAIPDTEVRSQAVSKEPPGNPQVVFNELKVDEATGTCEHPVDIRIGKKLSQVTGYDTCRLESVYWSAPVTK